jgi:cytosine deaminase
MNEGSARTPSPWAEQRRPDLVLRHGTLADGTHADVAIRSGRIARISPEIDTAGAAVEELEGQLVLPSLVDLHLHLDKAFTLELTCNQSGTLDEAMMRFGEARPRLTRESFVDRALRTLRLCAAAGTTAVRTHVNLYAGPIGVQPIAALVEVRERVCDWIDVQIVPFPAGNIAHDHTLREACEEALRLGADAVGGGPALDADPADLIATQPARSLVLRHGRTVARTQVITDVAF